MGSVMITACQYTQALCPQCRYHFYPISKPCYCLVWVICRCGWRGLARFWVRQ